MQLIDTHAHLNFADFNKDLELVLKRAQKSGVGKIIVPSSEKNSAKCALEISSQYQNIFAAIGVHPLYITGAGSLFVENGAPRGFYLKSDNNPATIFYLREFEEMLNNQRVVAIGEIGLDYFEPDQRKNLVNRELQLEVLQKNFELAIKYNKPVIVHLRTSKNSNDAFLDFLEVVNKFIGKLRAVIHCYSADFKIAQKLIEVGFYISFTNLTFYNEATKKTFQKIDLNRVMLETDSPFLSPKKDAERNEPAFLKIIAQKLADLRGISFEELSRITTKNAESFFGI